MLTSVAREKAGCSSLGASVSLFEVHHSIVELLQTALGGEGSEGAALPRDATISLPTHLQSSNIRSTAHSTKEACVLGATSTKSERIEALKFRF